jgi:hypothetical protein
MVAVLDAAVPSTVLSTSPFYFLFLSLLFPLRWMYFVIIIFKYSPFYVNGMVFRDTQTDKNKKKNNNNNNYNNNR